MADVNMAERFEEQVPLKPSMSPRQTSTRARRPRAAWWLLALALLVGAIHVYPDLQFIAQLGSTYHGIPLMAAPDELTYVSRIARAMQGGGTLGNAMLYEHRRDPWVYSPLPEMLLAQLARLLHCSAAHIDVVATAVAPLLFILLAYGCLRSFEVERMLATVGAVSMTFGHFLFSRYGLHVLPRLYDPEQALPLFLVRPVSPQFHYLVFIAALIALVRWWLKPTALRMAWAVLGCGAQFYLNAFYWSWMCAGVVCLAMVCAIGGGKWRAVVLRLSVLFVGAFAIGLVYVMNVIACRTQPAYGDFLLRNGLIMSHQPIWSLFQVAMMLPVLAQWWAQPENPRLQFVVAFLIGGWVCLNQQIVTGRTLQPFHWESQMNKTMLLIALTVAIAEWRRRTSRPPGHTIWRLACGGLIALLLGHAVQLQRHYLNTHRPIFAARQVLTAPLAWIASHTPPDAVVVTSPWDLDTAEYVTILSGRYTYLSNSFFLAGFLTEQEIQDRCLQTLYWFAADPSQTEQWLSTHMTLVLGFQAAPSYPGADSERTARSLEQMRVRYRRIWEQQLRLTPYRADFALLSIKEWGRLQAQRAPWAGHRPVYQDGSFVVVSVII